MKNVFERLTRFYTLNCTNILMYNHNIKHVIKVGSGFGLGTVIAVGMLLISQIKIALRNETSIESWIIEKANWRRKEVLKTNQAYQFPYDFGSWRVNLSKIMDNGDGMHFETIEGIGETHFQRFSFLKSEKVYKEFHKKCPQSELFRLFLLNL